MTQLRNRGGPSERERAAGGEPGGGHAARNRARRTVALARGVRGGDETRPRRGGRVRARAYDSALRRPASVEDIAARPAQR